MEKKTIVFISYNKEDVSFAHKIADELTRLEINVWLAPRELQIAERLTDEITKKIRKSNFLIAIISADSITSDWVMKEIKIMKAEKGLRAVLPILLDHSELPSIFSKDVLYADFTNEENCVFAVGQLLNKIDPSIHLRPVPNTVELQ